jgi:hypothetical protein
MSEEDVQEYEMQAREAQRMAENSVHEKDKAAWLRVAAQWLHLLALHRSQAPHTSASKGDSSETSH